MRPRFLQRIPYTSALHSWPAFLSFRPLVNAVIDPDDELGSGTEPTTRSNGEDHEQTAGGYRNRGSA